jgi:hypothetical protein
MTALDCTPGTRHDNFCDRLIWRMTCGHRFFSKSLARLGAAGSARQTRIRIIEVIEEMSIEAARSQADVQRLCRLAGLPRATYYRHLAGGEAGECELRDLIQRICLKHRFYGYRRVTATLRRQGMVVNAKKVQRLMREDISWPAQGAVPEATNRPALGLSHRAQSGARPGAVGAGSNLGRPTLPMCI